MAQGPTVTGSEELRVAHEAAGEEGAFSLDVSTVPTEPGCYIMCDERDRPLYVGKAKNLRARIRTYVADRDTRVSVKFLMRRVDHIRFLVTTNEKEAFLLENSLIKQHKPQYNIRLKDDKTYVSLRLNEKEDFPRITVVRRYRKDGARYFGPYSSALAVRETLKQIHRVFPLRRCSDHVLRNRTRPCLYYQMKQCTAPCVNYIDRDGYHEIIRQVVMVLEGRSAELEKDLKQQIAGCAERLDFEKAALLRDRLYALHATTERQRTVAAPWSEDRDVFGYHREGRFTEIQVIFFRGGKLLGGRSYSFGQSEAPVDEQLGSFLLQYYGQGPTIPVEVLLPVELEDADTLAEILADQRGAKVSVLCPQRGDKRALVDMAMKNARSNFVEKRLADEANRDLLEQTQRVLQLPTPPQRIECYDISTIQGDKPVGAMVTFAGGAPDKARYRRFAIRAVEGQDDFGMLREVLTRRFRRGIEEGDLPDLVVIDGGKGQLNVAEAVFKDLGIEDLPAVGMAKARAEDGGHSPERFFLVGRKNPVVPPQHSPVVHLMTRIRDEAHRFAITYHRKKRTKATLRTMLTEIPGVGPARARELLNRFGSIAGIRRCSKAEIAALPGFSDMLAEAVLEHVLGKTDEGGT